MNARPSIVKWRLSSCLAKYEHRIDAVLPRQAGHRSARGAIGTRATPPARTRQSTRSRRTRPAADAATTRRPGDRCPRRQERILEPGNLPRRAKRVQQTRRRVAELVQSCQSVHETARRGRAATSAWRSRSGSVRAWNRVRCRHNSGRIAPPGPPARCRDQAEVEHRGDDASRSSTQAKRLRRASPPEIDEGDAGQQHQGPASARDLERQPGRQPLQMQNRVWITADTLLSEPRITANVATRP